MTEDDTFNALRRAPYTEVIEKINQWPKWRIEPVTWDELGEFVAPYGWSLNDFRNEWYGN